jgi:hypothetical protein
VYCSGPTPIAIADRHFGPEPNWPRVFDFGSISGSSGANFLFFTPKTHFGAHRLGIATGAGASDLDSASVLRC